MTQGISHYSLALLALSFGALVLGSPTPIKNDADKRSFDAMSSRGFSGFDKRHFDSFVAPFSGFDKRSSFDAFVGNGFTGFDRKRSVPMMKAKRAFDSFAGSFTGLDKRSFDSFGSQGFTGFD